MTIVNLNSMTGRRIDARHGCHPDIAAMPAGTTRQGRAALARALVDDMTPADLVAHLLHVMQRCRATPAACAEARQAMAGHLEDHVLHTLGRTPGGLSAIPVEDVA